MAMRAIVTGAAGFIGSNLVDRLLNRGHEVVGVDNLSTGSYANLRNAFATGGTAGEFILERIDVRSPDLIELVAAAEPDVIFHLAAQIDVRASVSDPRSDALTNILGTINVCEAARKSGTQRVVYAASGGSRYGPQTILPIDESQSVEPASPYAVSKLAGEFYLNAYAEMYGTAPICLALSNVFGPRQNPRGEAGVVAIFCEGLLRGREVTVFGDGTATRDYVYVDDVVDAFMRAAAAPLSVTGTFNIGTGSQTTVDEVYRVISDALGVSTPALYAPARTGEIHAISLDASRARRELSWCPSIDFAEGVSRTIAWLRTFHRALPVESESITDFAAESGSGRGVCDVLTEVRRASRSGRL